MRCLWCGEETPDGSTYCEKCGHMLEGAGSPANSEGAVSADASVELCDTEEPAVEKAESGASESEEPDAEASDGYSYASSFSDIGVSVDAIRRKPADEPLVEPPSPPIQPKLSRGRIAIVGVIAVLFSAAVILLAWATVMRVLGL